MPRLTARLDIELRELVLGACEADLQVRDLAEPAFVLGSAMWAMRLSRMSTSRVRWFGSGRRSEHLTQASLNFGAVPSQSL
ncbi:hypothetical protein ACWC09_36085 [Streptomyces sp. NPDC001617]